MSTDDDIRDLLYTLRKEAIDLRRATVVNAARAAGWTWASIAEALDMTTNGVARLPGVDSPWNRNKAAKESSDA